uniref:Agouti domain-containing protein n=1 Tax=Stegastes partitus TaxID=144197 RepID=A0A3B5AKD4_9TELE
MGFTIWLCVLCLQASLLSHAFDCSGASHGELCVSRQTADEQVRDALLMDVIVRGGQGCSLCISHHLCCCDNTGVSAACLSRFKYCLLAANCIITNPCLKRNRKEPKLSGSCTASWQRKMADRSRRHLVQAANKKKNKRKPRVGSFSLLSNDKKSTPLQVSLHGNPRAEEQLGQSGRMCKQSYKATLLGFIGSVWCTRLCNQSMKVGLF